METFLETEQLTLRRFTADDVDNLVELDSDPEVMRYINGGRPTPREEIERDVLPAYLAYYERDDGYGFWAAVEKTSGNFIGWFHHHSTKTRSTNGTLSSSEFAMLNTSLSRRRTSAM